MTERLAAAYPQARVTAIDIAPRFGRLYRGRTEGVTFSQETIENLASRQPASFDLVIIADVWHHVAGEFRSSFIAAVREAMAPGAHLVFKEWLPSRAPIHYLAAAADKYISRAPARFLTRDQLNALLSGTFGSGAVQQIASIPPWKNNVAALVCRSSD
jgi:2-polyprenyl-3-methyl-5-hydroxy-6-metoxy-1,4-benzoquinol methylase